MLETPSIPQYQPTGGDNLSGADNQQERLVQLSYLAGIIDGEGWVGVSKITRKDVCAGFILCPTLSIHMVGKDAIEHISAVFAAAGLPSYFVHRRDSSQFYITGYKRMTVILEAITPFLHIKKRQAELITELCRLRKLRSGRSSPTDEEMEIREAICQLNMKGKNPQRLYAADAA